MHIKPSNIKLIDNLATNPESIKNLKMLALIKLVKRKGIPIEANSDLNNIPALEYEKGKYIAFDQKMYPNGSFSLRIIHLGNEDIDQN